jgi:hypothetical protein
VKPIQAGPVTELTEQTDKASHHLQYVIYPTTLTSTRNVAVEYQTVYSIISTCNVAQVLPGLSIILHKEKSET